MFYRKTLSRTVLLHPKFFTGNLKVLDYIVTRVDDYAGQASDRTRRLASIALTRATGGKMANLVETNLNTKMKRLKKAKQKVQDLLRKSPQRPKAAAGEGAGASAAAQQQDTLCGKPHAHAD